MYKLLKIITGQEVIGKVIKLDEQYAHVEKPLAVIYRFHFASTTPSIALSKYMLLGDDRVIAFPLGAIIGITDPKESFLNYYNIIVDKLYDEYDMIIDREMNKALEESSESETEHYKTFLENFQSDVKN